MKRKLIAAAVVGAFAAPAVVFAQNSTVQIYGTLNAEYGFVSAPNSSAAGNPKKKNYDALNSGASNIGFKGEEKLGGGLSAWFQCESDVRFLSGGSATSGSLCDRNSAIGLKGGFGNFYIGTWDSPLKQAVGTTRILGDTGWLGVTHLLLSVNGGSNTFSDRNSNSINYDSPVFSGFQINLQTTSTGAAKNQTADGFKGRANSMNLLYSAGKLKAALGHTKRDDNAAAASANNAEDTATTVGAAYTFGKATVGLTYADMEVKTGAGVNTERKAWNLGLSYDLPGPHSVWAGYTDTSALKGAGGAPSTGAKEFQIGYKNALSKRTFAAIGYGRVSNDSAGTNSIAGTFSTVQPGKSSSVVSMQLNHKF